MISRFIFWEWKSRLSLIPDYRMWKLSFKDFTTWCKFWIFVSFLELEIFKSEILAESERISFKRRFLFIEIVLKWDSKHFASSEKSLLKFSFDGLGFSFRENYELTIKPVIIFFFAESTSLNFDSTTTLILLHF